MSVEPSTGHVQALVGGRDFDASQVNLALGGSAGMQPGSSFKTFVLADGLRARHRAPRRSSTLRRRSTSRAVTRRCTINNSDFEDHGRDDAAGRHPRLDQHRLRRLIDQLGPPGRRRDGPAPGRVGHRPRPSPTACPWPSAPTRSSPLDMAAGYATLANRGVRQEVTPDRPGARPPGQRARGQHRPPRARSSSTRSWPTTSPTCSRASSRAAPARRPRSAGPPPARRARPRTTGRPGSRATRPSCRPRCGWATATSPRPLDEHQGPGVGPRRGLPRRRPGAPSCAQALDGQPVVDFVRPGAAARPRPRRRRRRSRPAPPTSHPAPTRARALRRRCRRTPVPRR